MNKMQAKSQLSTFYHFGLIQVLHAQEGFTYLYVSCEHAHKVPYWLLLH